MSNILNQEYDVFDLVESDLASLDALEEIPNLEINEEDSDSEETDMEESIEADEETTDDVKIFNEASEDVNEIEDYLVQRRDARTKLQMEISEEHPNKQEKMEEQEISEEVTVEETEEIVEGSVEQEEIVAEQTEEVIEAEEVESVESIEEVEEVEEIEEAKKSAKKESDEEEDEEEEDDSEDSEEEEDEEEEEEEEEEEGKMKAEKKVKKEDTAEVESDDIKRLIESEENLTEGFKAKAALIFETEVRSQIAEAKEKIQGEYEEKLSEEVELINSTLSEQVDEYLTYAVTEWAKNNTVAIETSLRTSISEDFMSSLKTLFVENYIEVPDTKVDLFEQLESEVAQVKEDFDKTRAIAEQLAEKVDTLTREKVITESCEGLVETQAEKLKGLAENVDFEGEEKFRESVETLKEFYFKGGEESITEETEEASDEDVYSTTETIVEETASSEETKVSKAMQNYLSAIGRQKKLGE